MKKYSLAVLILFGIGLSAYPQLKQTGRYEMEKNNYDNYFTVVSAGTTGLMVFRDTDEYRRGEGNITEVVGLDTALNEKWKYELAVDDKYVLKGYEVNDSKLFLLYSRREAANKNYHLITVRAENGDTNRYDIKNEIELELSHLIIVKGYLVLGGYVRYSPTFVSYHLDSDQVRVVQGFFKDKSEIIDLRANDNGTFNVLTLEKTYEYYLKLRTHSPKGDILFEKMVELGGNYNVLNGKSAGFMEGNIAVTGTYSTSASNYSQGIYFAIIKPEGQKNITRFYNYADMEHFFDYMGEKRAARIRRRIESKRAKGQVFRYNSRLFVQEIQKTPGGYLLAAEIYDPRYERIGSNRTYLPYGFGMDNNATQFSSAANQNYVKRPVNQGNADEASHFRYLESVIIKLDNSGKMLWDNSFKIKDVETLSLEKVVDLNKVEDKIYLAYQADKEIRYKVIEGSEVLSEDQAGIQLLRENDEISHTYDGVGTVRHWYGNYFYVWGYHRVENKANPDVERRRSVLFINKVMFE